MADITMCANFDCPRRKQCYRATARPSMNQSWCEFSGDSYGTCEFFIQNYSEDDQMGSGADFLDDENVVSESAVSELTSRLRNGSLTEQIGGSHYKDMPIQPVEFIHANNIGFCEGAAIKYLCRWRAKGGVQDLEKAKHFIEMLIEMETDC